MMHIKWNKVENAYLELFNENEININDADLATKILNSICKHYTNHNDDLTKFRIYHGLKQINLNKTESITLSDFFSQFQLIFESISIKDYYKSLKN